MKGSMSDIARPAFSDRVGEQSQSSHRPSVDEKE